MTDYLVRLYDLPDPSATIGRLSQMSVIIRPAMAYEKNTVLEWVASRFGKGWADECDVAFGRQPVACHLATLRGGIVGFACFESTCRNFFGPIGVVREQRRHGVGKALLLSCLNAMAAMGYAYAVIGDGDPEEFYTNSCGAVPIDGSTPGIYRDRLFR